MNAKKRKTHLPYLEGLRGVMAVNVILSHFVIVYYPEMYFPEYAQDGGLLTLFAKTPLSIFVNGNIAVQFFFVLTGFLVCRSVILNDAERPSLIVEKFINRYFRLVVVEIGRAHV